MEPVEARSHTHAVMPSHRKRPPNQRAQDALSNSEWNDVALPRKEPSHDGSSDEGEGNQQGIGPVERRKNSSSEKRSDRRAADYREKPVRQIGIHCHLLEQTKSHIPQEMVEIKVMAQRAMQRTEANSHEKKPYDTAGEKRRGSSCCGP